LQKSPGDVRERKSGMEEQLQCQKTFKMIKTIKTEEKLIKTFYDISLIAVAECRRGV